MGIKVGELFVALGFTVDKKPAEDFNQETEKTSLNINKMRLAAIAAVETMRRFVDSTIDSTVALFNFNQQTGLFIENLQKWQVAGNLADISLTADQVASSIQSLQDNLTQIRLGGGNVAPFQLLGIDVTNKNAFQVLDNIREAIKGLDNATAVNLIQKAGLSPNFINVLRLSREEFEKLGKADFLSEQQRNEVLKLGTAITKLKISFVLLKDQAVAAIAPLLLKVIDAFNRISELASRVGSALMDIIHHFTGIGDAINVLIPIVGALVIAFSPLTATIAALFLLFDDLAVYLQGGDSVIGRIFNLFKEGGLLIKDLLIDAFNAIDTYFKSTELYKFFNGDKEAAKATGRLIGTSIRGIDALEEMFSKGKGLLDIFPGDKSINNIANSPVFNNIFNLNGISSNVIDDITSAQQSQLNYAFDDLNNGNKL